LTFLEVWSSFRAVFHFGNTFRFNLRKNLWQSDDCREGNLIVSRKKAATKKIYAKKIITRAEKRRIRKSIELLEKQAKKLQLNIRDQMRLICRTSFRVA